MYIHIYIHMYTYVQIAIYVYIYVYIHTYEQNHLHVFEEFLLGADDTARSGNKKNINYFNIYTFTYIQKNYSQGNLLTVPLCSKGGSNSLCVSFGHYV